jgi:glucose-1-phosphate thymidylyltransferase
LESNVTLLKKWGGEIANNEGYENTIIIPPVSIAPGCEIQNSVIGPNVTIGEKSVINYSVVKESIVGSFTKLYDVVLHDSLIGSDTVIKGETRTLNIGDNTEIDLG